jgi:hypothetical protein
MLKRIRHLERHLNGLKIIPATSRIATVVILALLSKTLTVGRAICALVDAGFPAEAFGMSRTLMDLFFTVRYITNKDTEERATRYVKYHARVRVEWKKIADEYFPDIAKTLKLDDDILKAAQEFESRAHWAGRGGQARMMAVEDDSFEKDNSGKPITSKLDYAAFYFWASHYVHGTIEGIKSHEIGDGEVFRVRARPWEENKCRSLALSNIAMFTCKIFVYGLRAIHEEQPKALNEMYRMIPRFAPNKRSQ